MTTEREKQLRGTQRKMLRWIVGMGRKRKEKRDEEVKKWEDKSTAFATKFSELKESIASAVA